MLDFLEISKILSTDNLSCSNYRKSFFEATKRFMVSKSGSLPKSELSKNLENYGFCILHVENASENSKFIIDLLPDLGLEKVYLPHHYDNSNNHFDNYGINKITADESVQHQGFSSRMGQGLHVDGTLQPIGFVRTSIIACVRRAESGGDSIVFNAIAAFREILNINIDFCLALMNQKALTRTDVGRTGAYYTGPVYEFKNNEIFTRFSVDNTSKWQYGHVENLQEAHNLINEMSKDECFSLKVLLEPGDIMVIRNAKVSHGRLPFLDGVSSGRFMFRALFLDGPMGKS